MNTMHAGIAAALITGLMAGPAAAGGRNWLDHAPPFDFLFGNHFDTHQQTRETVDGDLAGFLYVTFTGEVTPDGFPVAQHCTEMTPPSECVVGWILSGKPGTATFLYHTMDHPVWLAESRNDIPQPGGYGFFQWVGEPHGPEMLTPGDAYDGYFLELQAVDTFAFRHAGEDLLVRPGLDLRTHLNIVTSTVMSGGMGDGTH
jgi:hypothetical protein